MKYLYLIFLSFFFVNFSFSQTEEIHGVTVTVTGVTKSLSEIIAHQKAHPTPDIKVPLRPELDGPTPIGQYPGSKPGSTFGSVVGGNTSTTTTTSTTTSSILAPYSSNFLAIWGRYGSDNGDGRESPYTPPDNCGDVGATQVIATANCRMKVFAKPSVIGTPSLTPLTSSTTTLNNVLNIDLNSFFADPTRGITGISDPHVRYDRLTGRWFIVAIDIDHRTNNYCCIAVSDPGTLSASTNFKIYYFSISQTGGSSRDFFDYPTLGVDQNSLYIGGNMFRNQSSFSGCSMWVVNKASIVNGTTMTVTGFHQTVTHTDMYTPQGVHNDDPNAANGYFVGASQSYYSKLVIRRVSYSGSTPTLSGDLNLSTLQIYTPKTVPTLGGTSIDGGDRRLYAAMIKKNKITGTANLWIAQGTKLNSSGVGGSGGDRDGALWMEIENLSSTPAIFQSATLYDGINAGSSAVNYIYPTIALSGQGHNLMGFTSAGSTKYCQAAVATRFRTDAKYSFGQSADFTAADNSPYNPGASRWGDYTQTVVDPEDDMTMWTFSEYAATTNSWGVRAAQFKAPPPATPVIDGTTLPTCGTTTTVTINGTSTNHSEFFDPGAGYTKRITISVNGPSGVTVANVIFVNPLQIKADFTVPANASNGTTIVTITNPDGQSATTSFTLTGCITTLRTTNLITSATSSKPAISSPTANTSVTTNSTTIQKNIISKTTIYPNPVHDILNLISTNITNANIRIIDSKGHLLRQIVTTSNNPKINVSNLPSGMYIIKLISDNKVEVHKFIKN